MTQYPQNPDSYPTRGSGEPHLKEALSYGFNATFKNPSFWLVLSTILLVGSMIVGMIWGFMIAAPSGGNASGDWTSSSPQSFGEVLFGGVTNIVVGIFTLLMSLVLLNAALRNVGGEQPSFSRLLEIPNFKTALIVGLVEVAVVVVGAFFVDLIALSTTKATAASTSSGEVAMTVTTGALIQLVLSLALTLITPLTTFWKYVALDGNTDVRECIKQGFAIGRKHYVKILGYLIIVGLLAIPAALMCGLGLIVWIPVAVLMSAYLFREMTGGPLQHIA